MLWTAKPARTSSPGNSAKTPCPLPASGPVRLRRRRNHRRVMILSLLAWFALWVTVAAQDESPSESFAWNRHRTTPIDLLIDAADVFDHGTPGLNSAEQDAWQELLEQVNRRRQALRDADSENAAAQWESAFYRFADVRQTAWEKGTLQIRMPQAKKDPFRTADDSDSAEPTGSTVPEAYAVVTDIQNHPHDFVGKPVVMQGILQRPQEEVLESSGRRQQPEGTVLTVGDLLSFDGHHESIARVHITGVERTSGNSPGIGAWPGSRRFLPVLVKGWVVKLWDDRRPLIYTESVRELSVQPPTALIRRYTVAQRPLLKEESWLYYETIRTLETVNGFRSDTGQRFWQAFPGKNPPESPRQAAENFLKNRLYDLLAEIAERFEAEKAALEQDLKASKITEEKYDFELRRLRYLVSQRINRHSRAQQDPGRFDTYVDLFLNPDVWQGQLITLRGHVRHVISYPAAHPDFRGRQLYELWLFTDDSQNNPAVIITPSLPEEFPVSAELIDRVSVTGCVFKQYVYRGQKSRRIAPLILTDSIQWSPTDRQLLALQEAGHLASGSPLAQRAQLSRSEGPGGLLLLLVCFAATLTVMVWWGRAQRDRRERRNLLNRIAEKPEFESLPGEDYAPRLSEYTSGYEL